MSEAIWIAIGIVLGVGAVLLVYGLLLFVGLELASRIRSLWRELSFRAWRWRRRRKLKGPT